jgi:membrane glycosyltransferase
LAPELAATGDDAIDGLTAVHADPIFRARHEQFLPPAPRRHRGTIDPELAVAEAILNDAETIEDAVKWPKPKERVVVLHDRALIDRLARLPATKITQTGEAAAA